MFPDRPVIVTTDDVNPDTQTVSYHMSSPGEFLIDEVQVGSVDSVSNLWEDIFTSVLSIPVLSSLSISCVTFSRYIR